MKMSINKKHVITISLIFIIGIIAFMVVPSFSALTAQSSITITSSNVAPSDPGGWNLTKSINWSKEGVVDVTMTFESTPYMLENDTDVLLILDNSYSMNGAKLTTLKANASSIINSILDSSKTRTNKVAIVSFSDSAKIETDFTANSENLYSIINGLVASGETNYYDALIKAESLLENYYYVEGRTALVLFLTDGAPNINTPNEVNEYLKIKEEYPFAVINGVQYQSGSKILQQLKRITDNQFNAYDNSLDNALISATVPSIKYETIRIDDLIASEYFELDETTLKNNRGTYEVINDEDGTKLAWNIDDTYSGLKNTFTYSLKLKEKYWNSKDVIPIANGTNIQTSLGEYGSENVESTNTPASRVAYRVIYQPNNPSDCKVSGTTPDTQYYMTFKKVAKSHAQLSCPGYQFKGWKIATAKVKEINDDYFEMPTKDTYIRAIWTKMDISLSTSGEISGVPLLYDTILSFEKKASATGEILRDNEVSSSVPDGIIKYGNLSNSNGQGFFQYTGPSADNGSSPIYFYRGYGVMNNNVKFAGYCWKIFRTTETKGIKLIYNGHPTADGSCINGVEAGEDTIISTSPWNTKTQTYNRYKRSGQINGTFLGAIGYTYGTNLVRKYDYTVNGGNYLYGTGISYEDGMYKLVDPEVFNNWNDYEETKVFIGNRPYSCLTTSDTCETVVIINDYLSDNGFGGMTYFELHDGKDILDEIEETRRGTTDTDIKILLEQWYDDNIQEKYGNIIEDTVYCNNRNVNTEQNIEDSITPDGFFTSSLLYRQGNLLPRGNEFYATPDSDKPIGYTYYYGYSRVSSVNGDKVVASLMCDKVDSYTVNESSYGNGLLRRPIGLITIDEALLAGVSRAYNTNVNKRHYLTCGYEYWTMNPANWLSGIGIGFTISGNGKFSYRRSVTAAGEYLSGVRPVISLGYNAKYGGGNGSQINPYEIKE